MTRFHRAAWALPVLFAAILYFLLSHTGASGKSAAYDEPIHLLSGMRILREGDHDFNHEHPPLMKALAALPVLATGAAKPLVPWTYEKEYDEWPLSHDWLYHANDGDKLLALGRTPIALAGAILCLCVGWVAFTLIGNEGGENGGRSWWPLTASAAAAFLFALEPNLLAHGSLITTDMGMSLFFFVTVAAFWRYLETRGRGWLVATGLLWGLGLLAKFTSVVLLVVMLVMGILYPWLGPASRRGRRRNPAGSKGGAGAHGTPPEGRFARLKGALADPMPWDREDRKVPAKLLVSIAFAGLLAVLVLNAGYGFDGSFTSLRGMNLESEKFKQWGGGSMGAWPIPAPAAFVMGFDHAEAGGQRWWSYLMGEHSMTGWKHYYIVALLVKTSLPLLVLALAGLVLAPMTGLAGRRPVILLALAPVIFVGAFTMSGNLKNIGLRYILPVYPFLCLLGGLGAVALARRFKKPGVAAAALLILWAGGAEAALYPDHLAYFNEIAGGPEGGRWWLLDSNIDWGQDLKGLAAWMRENDVKEIYLDYFGRACPEYYGIARAVDFRGGYLAVSANHLAGVYRSGKNRYAFLEGREPVAVIGHSILVYDVERPPGWKGYRGDSPHEPGPLHSQSP